MKTLKETIKSDTNLEFFHETSTDGHEEILLVFLNKNTYLDFSTIIEPYIFSHQIENISSKSLEYFKIFQENHYIILLDKISKKNLFFDEDIKTIKNNIKNELSKKITGEVIDTY